MARLRWLFLLTFLIACYGTHSTPVYVDVRTPAEYASGHVRGALNIPHDQLEVRWRELERHSGQNIVVYCRSGRRSALAAATLREKGFLRVEDGGPIATLVAAGVSLE